MVDEVVGNLEGQTDIASIAAIRSARLRRHSVHDAGGLDRIFDQRAGLELLKARDRRDIELPAFRRQIHHLAAGHPGRSRGPGKFQHEIGPNPRVLVRFGIGQDFERQRVQAVAGQDRFRLAEGLVNRELATPELRIVHARQIVMNQRIDVDGLDGAADAKRARTVDREQPRRRHSKQRPKPLATADRGVPHRII